MVSLSGRRLVRDEVAPLALLLAALGLALAFAPRDARAPSLLALVASTAAFASVPAHQVWHEGILLGCWLSVIATAASVHLAYGFSLSVAVVLSLNAGIWAGSLFSMSGARIELLTAWLCLLIVLPATWAVRRYSSVPVKVVSSWVIAVAALAVALQLLPVTPGYLPDHME
jgi:hypothetical protein